MDDLEYWRLCEELTVVQAALLIASADPSTMADHIETWASHKRPDGYEAAKAAVSVALLRGRIDGHLVPKREYDSRGNECGDIPDSVDVSSSYVKVESLRRWLSLRGYYGGFFRPAQMPRRDYLDPLTRRYAPKLAAAIRAWEGTGDPGLLEGRTPKQALTKWLREHAEEFGLVGEDGRPNETGIEEIAKVANWQPAGGAPKTPG